VFRFGGHELAAGQTRFTVIAFFDRLLGQRSK